MALSPAYDDGRVQLYHGDARDILTELAPGCADMVLTDPPYGMAYEDSSGTGLRGDAQRQGIRIFRQTMPEMDRVLAKPAHAYVFCHWESWPDFYDAIAPHWDAKNLLVWDKRNYGTGDCEADYAHDYELIAFAHVGGRRFLNQGRDLAIRHCPIVRPKDRSHNTQKPVDLLRFYVEKSTNVGEVVLDPFCGTGSTLLAAASVHRRAIGVELDRKNLGRAIRRLEEQRVRDGAA